MMVAGCDAFIAKPVNVRKLLGLLETHLKLEWVYDEAAVVAELGAATAGPETPTVPRVALPPKELALLRELATTGDMRGVQERAAYLAQMDKKYAPLARRLEQLARSFQEEQILDLIEMQQGEEP